MLDSELIYGWFGLQLVGAALAAVVRFRDRGRAAGEKRGGSLGSKYLSYFAITAVMLFAGTLPAEYVTFLLAGATLFLLFELRGSIFRQPPKVIRKVTTAGFSLILAGILGLWLIKRMDPSGNTWAWLWLIVATTDAYSQLFGQAFGRAKMAPRVSPGKTWAGFWLGTASAVFVGAMMPGPLGLSRGWVAAIVALFTSLAATAGDLIESWMKRSLGIKDFAHRLGEHGGVFDRFDSLLGAAPVFAVLLALIRLF